MIQLERTGCHGWQSRACLHTINISSHTQNYLLIELWHWTCTCTTDLMTSASFVIFPVSLISIHCSKCNEVDANQHFDSFEEGRRRTPESRRQSKRSHYWLTCQVADTHTHTSGDLMCAVMHEREKIKYFCNHSRQYRTNVDIMSAHVPMFTVMNAEWNVIELVRECRERFLLVRWW